MNIAKIIGIYNDSGKIELESMKIFEWQDLFNDTIPDLPPGIKIILEINIDEETLINGQNKIVWATFDLRQSEIIQSSLLAQQINSEIKSISFNKKNIFLIRITNEHDVKSAMEFIWKNSSGLRLKPDWHYAEGEKNKSFEQWLSGQ